MNILRKIIRFIYPVRCTYCGKVLAPNEICSECANDLPSTIREMGMPINRNGRELEYVNVSLAGYTYNGPIKKAIHRMKFCRHPELAKILVKSMIIEVRSCICLPKIDIILSVPQGKKERHRRLYCVQKILASRLHKALKIPIVRGVLIKEFDTVPQVKLTGETRRSNLLGVITVKNASKIKDKNILIVDDVLTTGSTLNECAKMLLFAGAKSCHSVCIAGGENK